MNPRNLVSQRAADDPGFADKCREMKGLLLAEQRRQDDPWWLWDQPQKE